MSTPLPQSDLQLIEQLLARQPVETMERLARHFTPSALRRRRLVERDDGIRALAVGRPGSGRKIASDIHKELRRYAAAGFQFERDRPPADPRRGEMRRALVRNRGKVPSEPTIVRALAGLLPVSKSVPAMIRHTVHPSSRQEPRGRDEGCTTAEGLHRAAGR